MKMISDVFCKYVPSHPKKIEPSELANETSRQNTKT